MARIKTEQGTDLRLPGVSFAPVRIEPSPIAEIAQRVGPVLSQFAEIKAQKNQQEETAKNASGILKVMNNQIDNAISNIGEDFTPTQAIVDLKGKLNTLLSESSLPPEKWSAVRSQVESRVDDLGKQHYLEVDGHHMVIDMVTNETRSLVKPGDSEAEWFEVGSLSGISDVALNYVQTLDPEKANNLMLNLGRIEIEQKFREAKNQTVSHARNQLGLERELTERDQPKNQAQFFSQFNTEAVLPLSRTFFEAIQTGADPEETAAAYEAEVTKHLSLREEELATAGTNSAEMLQRLRPVIDAQKEFMRVMSTDARNERELNKIKTRIGLEVAVATDQLPLQEKLLYENPGKLEALAQTAQMMPVFRQFADELIPNLFAQMTGTDVQRLVTVDNQLSPLERQVASSVFQGDDPVAYQKQVSKVLNQMNIAANDAEGNITMNHPTMIWMIENIKSHELWGTLAQEVPEVAAAFEEGEQFIRNIGE